MSTIKVQNIQHTASSTNAIALASDGTCTANITNNLSNRNLIINGAMQVAQRGQSGSGAYGYFSVDRWYNFNNGLDENPTMSQESLTSSDTPFSSGFRKYLRFKNGNQTSGAGASDQTWFRTSVEAQNVAQSGWNYTSSSSFITLSFWIRASVAQTYYGFLKAPDGSNYLYPFSMALSADTWTKVTKSISGNSNLAFDNDNGLGLEVGIYAYLGTSLTDNSVSLDTWAAYSSGTTRTPDHTTTWYTTNDSTIDITGVQLEVGSFSSDFEFKSFGQELALCQRYFQKSFAAETTPAVSVSKCIYQFTRPYTSGYHEALGNDYVVEMRAQPSVTFYPIQGSGSAGQVSYYDSGWANTSASYHTGHSTSKRLVFSITTTSSTTLVQYNYTLDAEL